MLALMICSVCGAGDRVGGGDCWDDGAEQVSQVQSLFLRYWAAFKIPEHFVCTHPEHLVHLAHSSTCDVASIYRTGLLCIRAWVRMYIARHRYEL